jgi:peptidoglycan/xylan/chitin deacetylase (PgdA/CDA1 family)
MIRRLIQRASATPMTEWLVDALERLDNGRSHLFAVLTYHRILDPGRQSWVYPGQCVHPAEFERQMRAVAARYQVIGLQTLLDAREEGAPLPRRSLLLTFDDAYRDFAEFAWPVLKALKLPATLFVPTDYPARPDRWFWWERLYEVLSLADRDQPLDTPAGRLHIRDESTRIRAFRRLRTYCKQRDGEAVPLVQELARQVDAPAPVNPVLDWVALRGLRDEGVAIAPHSRSHRQLPTLSRQDLDDELRGSRVDLEREIGPTPACLAYPAGAHDPRVVEAARAAGYRVAFTTRRGINDLRKLDWLALKRVNVGARTSSTLVRAQLGSWASLLR